MDDDEQIYQYYTIVNDEGVETFITDDPNNDKIMYLLEHDDDIYQLVDEVEEGKPEIQLFDGNETEELMHDDESGMSKSVPTTKVKKYHCTYFGCDKTYSTSHHLTVHMRNHTGTRPYQCNIPGCEKAFATGYSLKAHFRTHTGETPYACSVCPKQFKTSGDLQKHLRTHTGEKPFKCPIEGCNRSFTTSNIRKVHIRSHTGERPYACDHPGCGKAFASATNYKNHMRIHSGEKPYECSVPGCGKRFTEYSSLFKHNAVHKPFKPLKCEYCNQMCKHETTLKAHKQSMHKILISECSSKTSSMDTQNSSQDLMRSEPSWP